MSNRSTILADVRAGVISQYRAAKLLGMTRQGVNQALKRAKQGDGRPKRSGPRPTLACPRCGAVIGARQMKNHQETTCKQ